MKKNIYILYGLFIATVSQFNTVFSADDDNENTGLLKGIGDTEKIRRGDIELDDIPAVINELINIFLGIAGTVAVIFVIIGAYKLLFGSLKQDHTKGRETIIMALTGFAISLLAWFIVKFIFNNFSG